MKSNNEVSPLVLSEIKEQVDNKELIKRFHYRQHFVGFHPYTCCSQTDDGEICNRNQHDDGIMFATEVDGELIIQCPCGKSTQKWLHEHNILSDNYYREMFNITPFPNYSEQIKWFLIEYHNKSEEAANNMVQYYKDNFSKSQEPQNLLESVEISKKIHPMDTAKKLCEIFDKEK